MQHYQHTRTVAAPPETVYAALTTLAGLRGWWSEDCDGNPAPGGSLRFRFGPNHKDLRVDLQQPAAEVRWHCTAAHIAIAGLARPDEWVGTDIVFRLSPIDGGNTRLEFEHLGLTPKLSCYALCNAGWNHFLDSLARYAQTGRGTPHLRSDTACNKMPEAQT